MKAERTNEPGPTSDMEEGHSTDLLLRHNYRGDGEQLRPKEPWRRDYGKSIVYAGLDAIVTSFSLISSISAGHLSSGDVLVLGFANLVADGISMGMSDFLSSSTEEAVAGRERAITNWDVTNRFVPQRNELFARYQALGMSTDDATAVVDIFAKYKDIMVDEKMMTEKGTPPPGNSREEQAWKNGVVTFVAFIVFGCLPILSFILLAPFTRSHGIKFGGACLLSAVALALLGVAKARIAGQSYRMPVTMTLLNGAVAAAAAYGIGWTLRNVAGLED